MVFGGQGISRNRVFAMSIPDAFGALTPIAAAVVFATPASAQIPLSPGVPGQVSATIQEGYVDAGGGVRLFYRIEGTATDTIVVLHGGPGFSMDYLAADLEPLAARHALLFYDQRGTGRSTLVTDSASLDAQRFADDLEAVRSRFKLERLTLLGHSWGAAVAALYAERHPERIGRLLIVDGISVKRTSHARGIQFLDSRRDSATQRRLRELGAARLANPGDASTCRSYYSLFFVATFADTAALRRSRGDFCAGTPEALINKVRSVDRFTLPSLGEWDWRPGLRAVKAPALVIRGTMDHVPLESAREWTAALPNGRFLPLDGAGHFPYLELPDRFFTAVTTFLNGGWPAGAEAVSISPRR
jgi:proline iminopeptidase